MVRRILLRLTAVFPLLMLCAGTALSVSPVLLTTYRFHGFDTLILSALGYDAASVVYVRELASVTSEQNEEAKKYEDVGCNPFNVVKDGKIDETGFDCQSFFCIGYQHGAKQCKTADGKAYGGVVDINQRLSLIYVSAKKKLFTEFSAVDQTKVMKDKIASMDKIKCSPFYLMMFDVAVGEGYTCQEIGQFPHYSGSNSCVTDWRNKEGLVCEFPERSGELSVRQSIMENFYGVDFSVSSSVSSSVSGSSVSSLGQKPSFPDVVSGRYGFTAITDLAAKGVLRGYDDGTFRPDSSVNRAEFMKVLIAGLYDSPPDVPSACFPDVGDEWFSSFVCTGKRLGWLQGYPDGSFGPGRQITKAEALKVVIAALGLPLESTVPLPAGVPETAWYTPYVRKAVERGVLLEKSFNGSQNATRADVAVWIYRARNVKAQGVE